jgi:DNA invertase Pin-like site-specific DNA recombinase
MGRHHHIARAANANRHWRAGGVRDLIRARTGEGRARAVARGQRMGRPPKLTPLQRREAIKRRDHGEESLTEIGRSYNVSAATISRLAAF